MPSGWVFPNLCKAFRGQAKASYLSLNLKSNIAGIKFGMKVLKCASLLLLADVAPGKNIPKLTNHLCMQL